jgi:hypothetical protein
MMALLRRDPQRHRSNVGSRSALSSASSLRDKFAVFQCLKALLLFSYWQGEQLAFHNDSPMSAVVVVGCLPHCQRMMYMCIYYC